MVEVEMNLPKYLYADDGNFEEGDPRQFVIHNYWPRFIMEFCNGVGTPHFWDSQEEIIRLEVAAGREPSALIARLMREAGDFYNENALD